MSFFFEAIEYPRGKTAEQFIAHVVESAMKAERKGYHLDKVEMHCDSSLRQRTAIIHYADEKQQAVGG